MIPELECIFEKLKENDKAFVDGYLYAINMLDGDCDSMSKEAFIESLKLNLIGLVKSTLDSYEEEGKKWLKA